MTMTTGGRAPRRGDIWWADFGPYGGRRLGVVLTRDSLLPHLTNVTLVSTTTTIRGIATEVLLTPRGNGVPRRCVVNGSNVHTIPQSDLLAFVSRLDGLTLYAVVEALHDALDLEY